MCKHKNKMNIRRIILIISLVIVVCVIAAVVINYCIAALMLSRFYEPDLVLTSPDGQYELVVREYDCLGGSGAEVYIRKTGWYNSWIKKKIGSPGMDNYYMPFAKGKYYVEWEDDKVTLYYCEGRLIEDMNDSSTWVGILSYNLD